LDISLPMIKGKNRLEELIK